MDADVVCVTFESSVCSLLNQPAAGERLGINTLTLY